MVDRFFGDDGDDAKPLWFNRVAFSEEGFDPDAYIASLRGFVPLDTLRSELRSHLSALKNELVELINRDYDDFVNLSTNLVDVDGAVRRMTVPLQDLRANLVSVRDNINGSLLAVQDALKRRDEATESREILELLLDTSHVVSKVEKLLEELTGMRSQDHPTDLSLEESRSRLLERIASEMNRLKFYVARAQDLPYIKIISKRIQNADALLGQNLRRCFELALERRDDKVLYHCLRAYAAVDDTAGAEDAFRCTIVAPIMQRVFPSSHDKSPANGNRLDDHLRELEKYIQSDCKFLLDIVASENSGLHVFNFLGNSIVKEVQSAIQKAKPGALSFGKPDEFLENYKSSMKFLDFVEGFCKSETEVLKLRSQVAYSDYVKLWNLEAYFRLRFQEIAFSLDNLLVSDLRRAEEDSFSFVSSIKLSECLQRCWDGDIYIPALSDKFLRLALQLIHRYITWLSSGLDRKNSTTSTVTWASSASLDDLLLLRRDVELLHEKIIGPYVEDVVQALTPAAEKVLEIVKRSIIQAAGGLLDVATKITDVLVAIISGKCCEVAKGVKTLTTTFRLIKSKPVPTQPSPYASNILHDLKEWVEHHKDLLTDASRAEIITSVVEKVTAFYEEQIRELVESVRKTETSLASLARFRNARQQKFGTGTEKTELTDLDKIMIQVFLDVEEYGKQIEVFGLSLSRLPVFTNLMRFAEDNKPEVQSSVVT